jgi:hypothetical protein
MSPPATSGIGPRKRCRTVEGSCWPCKQRRVKCDLQKPVCHRCSLSKTDECNYDKVLLKWKKIPASSIPVSHLRLTLEHVLDGSPFATNERRAIDYFKARLWPLFSTVHEPCPPPIALALRSQPVLQALCVFAEEYRALQERGSCKQTLDRRRVHCLAAIRDQLGDNNTDGSPLAALLVAVLLLYFLEGYVNCTNNDASTRCHLAGALAIINALGGFESAWSSSDRITRMLLSELASTDLTDALLQNREPSFSAAIWERMETGSVWWETVPGTTPLNSVLCTMAEMSFYRQDLQDGIDICNDKVQEFERALQPTYSMLDDTEESGLGRSTTRDKSHPVRTASLSLVRAFQHAGLIYLYSAIHKILPHHFLVQQHVHACLECIQGMDKRAKAQNCALFPLYVAGAHASSESHRTCVLEILDTIHTNLGFQSVLSVRSTLQKIWQPDRSPETWTGTFQNTAIFTLVI